MIDVTRSLASPSALAREEDGCWRDPEVLDRLFFDFLGKCYLCERSVQPGSFEVDHRVPKAQDPSRCFDWKNLFPICHDCNLTRPRKVPDGGLLDPGAGQDLEARLVQGWHIHRGASPAGADFHAAKAGDLPAENTAAELDWMHDRRHPKAQSLRDTIRDHLMAVLSLERDWMASRGPAEERALRSLLSRRSPFTMLARSIVLPETLKLAD